MDKEQFNRAFLPKEIVLKLYSEIPPSDYKQRINLINDYTRTIKDSIDSDVFKVRYNNEIGFIYLEAKEYALAIPYFEKALKILSPKDYSFLYFHIIGLLIRCNRHISNYSDSFKWADKAFRNIEYTESSFEKLNILGEYVDLLTDTGEAFNYKLQIINQIIEDLGFPEQLTDPKETINSMRRTHQIWNRKLSEIVLMKKNDKNSLIIAYERYKEDCPIKWYRDYADETIKRIKYGR